MKKILLPHRITEVLSVGLVGMVLCNLWLPSATAGEVSKIWYELYLELNPTQENQVVTDALWLKSVSKWAEREQERLEPIVIEILEGKRPSTPWTRALSVTRAIPTKGIRDVLIRRIDDMWNKPEQLGYTLDKIEHRRMAYMMVTMAEAGDGRVTEILNQLLESGVPVSSIEAYLKALQHVGDENSISIVRGMDKGRFDGSMTRLVNLTTKIIEARIEKRAFLATTAPQDLRKLIDKFLKSCETADIQSFKACFPWGFNKVIDEGDMHEFLDGEHGKPAIDAIRAALDADTSFEIDRKTLQAKLVCDGSYTLEYIYEVDGWKIMKILPLAPARAHHDAPLRAFPQKNGSKRIIIGKPAKD